MKTVARFDFPEFAHLARTVLADHEIEAFVFDEHIVQMDWLYLYAIGGVRLVVDPEDRAEAVRILRSCSRVEMDGKYEKINLPAGHLLAFFLSFFTAAPCLLFGRKTYYIDPQTRKVYWQRPEE